MGRIITINDDNWQDFVDPNRVGRSMGLIPRDFNKQPVGCMAAAPKFDIPLIPESEWDDRLREQDKNESSLWHLWMRGGPNGGPIPPLDQNGVGYCWCHSVVSCILMARARDNQPYVDLSPFFIGSLIKNYRDEGGWNLEAMEFLAANGVPEAKYWPQRKRDRSLDTPEMRANAARHKADEWMDLDDSNWAQVVTCLLLNLPLAGDYNFWGHSVGVGKLVSLNPRKVKIINSWGDWGEAGWGDLEGGKACPNAATALRTTFASAA